MYSVAQSTMREVPLATHVLYLFYKTFDLDVGLTVLFEFTLIMSHNLLWRHIVLLTVGVY